MHPILGRLGSYEHPCSLSRLDNSPQTSYCDMATNCVVCVSCGADLTELAHERWSLGTLSPHNNGVLRVFTQDELALK